MFASYRDANPPYFRRRFLGGVCVGGGVGCVWVSISTPKFGNLFISDKFCAIEVACNFEKLLIFCLNPPYFLDVYIGISEAIA